MASTVLVAHIWTFNDWCDFDADRLAPGKLPAGSLRREIAPGTLLAVSVILLFVSMALFVILPRATFIFALAISLLGILYSFPGQGWKGVPLLSSAAHLAGGLLHFLLGYSLFAAIDQRAVLMAPFFALIFMSGHAIQEIQDHGADLLAGVRTNAVAFGKTAVFFAGSAGFTAAYGLLFVLSWNGVVSSGLRWVLLGVYPLHLIWSIQAFRAGLSEAGVRQLRTRYRVLIALLGGAIVAQQLL